MFRLNSTVELQGTVRSQNGKGADGSITGNRPSSVCRPFTLRRRLPVLPSRGERVADGSARSLIEIYAVSGWIRLGRSGMLLRSGVKEWSLGVKQGKSNFFKPLPLVTARFLEY